MTEPDLTLRVEDDPRPEDVAVVGQGLDAFNRSVVGYDDYRRLAVFLRDADGAVVGGLVGGTDWGWLVIDLVWIEERLRGQGHGDRPLAAAEEEAVRRGCAGSLVDTLSFQAPAFSERRGYEIRGEVPDFPPGHRRLYLTKRLGEAGGGGGS